MMGQILWVEINQRQRRRPIMQITITCPLIVADDLTDINVLEAEIVAWGRQVMAAAFTELWQQYQATAPDCPHCASVQTVADGWRPYQLRAMVGPMKLVRQRRRCRGCGAVYQPLDDQLHAAGPGRATAGLTELAVLAGSSWPFATAAWVLQRLSGTPVSAEWVRQVSEQVGTDLGQTQAEDAEAQYAGQLPLPVVEPPPQQMLVALDGGWVGSRQQPGGMEGKVAVIATGCEQIGQQRWRLTGRRYVARFQSSERFGVQVYQAAAAQGIAQARKVVLLGDGAAWIRSIAELYFPEAQRRLDLWHLLRRASEALAAEDLDETVTTRLHTALRAQLRRGAVAEAEQLVADHLPGPVGQAFRGYLHNQRAWIVDAQRLQDDGEVVGSGAVEKAVDVILNRRFKGRRGMRWCRANADAITVVRTHVLNQQPLVA
jgi:hypothetical protein